MTINILCKFKVVSHKVRLGFESQRNDKHLFCQYVIHYILVKNNKYVKRT